MIDEDLAPCGLVQTAEDGVFRRVNKVFCDWLGYRADALVGKRRLQDLLAMGARIFHQTHWSPLLLMQGSLSEVKLELVHADGTRIPMVLNAIRRTANEVVVHEVAVFVARDRDRYEQELLQSRRRLEAALAEITQHHAQTRDRALFAEQMVGIVSHDLRNPLAAIGMGLEMLAATGPEAIEVVVPRMTRALRRANALIADLLDFTAARVGRGLVVTRVPGDLHAVVGEVVGELRGVYPARELVHAARGPGDCRLDANRVAQLVGNLVSNAVAYGAPESPVSVTSAIDGDACRVAVHNRGAPIPPGTIDALFEPMVRGTTAGSPKRSVGLGLYIVREIARAHGGDVEVESTADAGTTFVVHFPRG